MIATLPQFGEKVFTLWYWGAGCLGVFLLMAIILTGVSMIKRLFR